MASRVERVEIDATELGALAQQMGLLFPMRAKAAARRALDKTIRGKSSRPGAREHIVNYISTHANVPKGVLSGGRSRKGRVFVKRTSPDDLSVSLWLGSEKVHPRELTKNFPPKRKGKFGVKVGKHVFPGAFVATMPTGHVGIFKRKTDWRHRFPRGRTSGRKHGLKIKEQFVSLEPHASRAIALEKARIEANLSAAIEAELDVELERLQRRGNA